MNRSIYSALLYLLLPLLVLYLAFRSIKSPDYRRRWGERFGLTKLKHSDLLIHSVSMGETLAAIPLIKAIQQRYPQMSITVTTTSPTGSAEVVKAFGTSVQHCYLPFDISICVGRFLRQVSPKQIVIMETELWPNLIHQASSQGMRLMLANARLSDKSARQYSKRMKLIQPMLQSLDIIAAQSQQTADRFIELGVSPSKINVCGSLKFDLSIPEDKITQAKALRQQWREQSAPIWVAGSVHPGEFDAIIEAHKRLLAYKADALLVIVPRHPEQFNAAAEKIVASGLSLARRSQCDEVDSSTQVLLGDTMGELLTFYGAADQAFIGGTLINNGGHNPLEPAAFGLPVYVGPNHWDFAEITCLLQDAGALKVIASADELAEELIAKFDDKLIYQTVSEASLRVVDTNKGALKQQCELVCQLIDS
ncbi:lipid IV(A) 3-deoxy-D-manno-octulosonic acid transferase [Shewanella sp. D64]|uniref:lipid IV(A) 3-deoxy-D-manno-octulosonic acid transferase n=1 Tax=unclassified Shewanella TaxID=196818 RepID=UPI0022BA207B|nr:MULTISPECIES: lipid IV(A) 3-deoxy-D-manno-octulosonic acid transferase [unclassified Shewanella]MEC4725886.1 lipid IV(A) 3-deoxy-D-manno-octulosonic acid transferase [Shewanella sp. D64]MEC4737141.1 lipid IV(A) 3-deoxy-D-manno-octulosonic acid transferase [Shewanella sp. E94]WBJ95667.1 lipid IV(A) 3-deoxy-D-manno-octulosonic acid transferase [Shewanella sp. MTB7]